MACSPYDARMPVPEGKLLDHNRAAWNGLVERGDRWTCPVDTETVARARAGDWSVILTPQRPVPRAWFPESLSGIEVLGLACGGGQQGPVLAAAGARVTIFDLSDRQLGQDRAVAEREGLAIATVQGRMDDLSAFDSGRFDLIFHPVSNVFAPDVRPVWREAARVLKPGGALLAGFANPVLLAADEAKSDAGELVLVNRIPYAEADDPAVRAKREAEGRAMEFGHSLEDQIGGQLAAGLVITGFYEDYFGGNEVYARAFDAVMPTFIATRAVKGAILPAA